MKKMIAALLLSTAFPAYADNCDNPSNDFDGLYCLNKVYIQADKDLNESYQQLKIRLEATGVAKLRKGQLAWMKNRNSDCSYYDDNGEFFVNMRCTTDTTIERTNFLNDRVRECKATGCQPSKL
jgi:uncharacterized protein YecT (DUF1311 family)